MATRLPPALNLAVLCSYVEFDGNQQPFSLVEPQYAIGLVPNEHGRLPAPELAFYVQLDDEHAVGTFWLRAEVCTASGIMLPGGRTAPVEKTFRGDADPLTPFEHVFRLAGLVFPVPGRYYFHVLCNHISLHSRDPVSAPPCLRVLPKEVIPGGFLTCYNRFTSLTPRRGELCVSGRCQR